MSNCRPYHPQGPSSESAVNTWGKTKQLHTMLNWAITFLVIALIAAVFGFGILAGTAMQIAKILFFVFLVLFIVSFLMGKRTPRV
jgi:uncharacterized membrane protein YtjA (UPF0391 family)